MDGAEGPTVVWARTSICARYEEGTSTPKKNVTGYPGPTILYPKSHLRRTPNATRAPRGFPQFYRKRDRKVPLFTPRFDGSRLTQLSQFPGFFFRYFRKKERNGSRLGGLAHWQRAETVKAHPARRLNQRFGRNTPYRTPIPATRGPSFVAPHPWRQSRWVTRGLLLREIGEPAEVSRNRTLPLHRAHRCVRSNVSSENRLVASTGSRRLWIALRTSPGTVDRTVGAHSPEP